MKRAAVVIGILMVLGFVGGFLYARFTTEVVPTMKEQREAVPTRIVAESWHVDKFSPGHSQHVVNQAQKCNACHDPAREDFSGVDIGVCTACHEEQASHPHLGAEGEITECFTCHAFKFDSDADSPWDCVRCHGPFDTPTHTGLDMHTSVPCESCHHPHEPFEDTIRRCDDCHKKMNVQHGRPKLSGSCADCHGGHKLASDAAACMECHETEKPRVSASATFGGGHDSCATCHEAHAFSASSALGCASCHERTQVLAQNSALEHRDCSSCHKPHAVRAAGDRTCKGCHKEIASTHTVKKGDCISCHDPHPRRVAQIAFECSHCHEEARSERAFHAKKTACTDCHQPHRFDLSRFSERALCVRCHAPQIRLTSRNLGHSSCESCHEGTAHELSGMVACGSCHDEILTGSPEGHQECASCHEPHGGTVTPETACTSCHAPTDLPGLHRVPSDPQGPGHSDCSSCHNVHSSTVRADRASCMECHDDMADHQPEAEVCTGCHTFIKAKPRR